MTTTSKHREAFEYLVKLFIIMIFFLIQETGLKDFRACLHGGGGPQIGEVTRGALPYLLCKRDRFKMRDYMDRQVTSPT